MNGAVILLSGGMDSATLLRYIGSDLKVKDVYAISFIYGQKHSRELEMAKWQAKRSKVKDHKIIDISFFGDLTKGGSALTDASIDIPRLEDVPQDKRMQPPTYVPNRNMVMLSLAASYAESLGVRDVFYGAQAQDFYGYWDCTQDFINRINSVLDLNRNKPIRIHAPFSAFTKADIVRKGKVLGVDYEHTWSCYRGGDEPCGNCPSCVERIKAFEEAGSDGR